MQLIWISGATGRVVKFAITRKKLYIIAVVMVLASVGLGALINFIGLRITLNQRPDIVREIGGVLSPDDKSRLESKYSDQLTKIQSDLKSAFDSLRDIDALKNNLLNYVQTRDAKGGASRSSKNSGGPYIPLGYNQPPAAAQDFNALFDVYSQDAEKMKGLADQLRSDLKENYSLIASLPIGNPLDHELSVSSEFGYRHDPINGRLATHSGLDLESRSGEPVFATADGEIDTAEWSGSYGNMVEIRHANGFLTRYGHLKTIRVKLGDHVNHHQLIGQVGSTGRSTGPHLHYEIIAATGRTIDPKDFLGWYWLGTASAMNRGK